MPLISYRGVCAAVRWGGLVAAILVLSGCDSQARHQLSGTVTYQGKPVTMGSVRFEAEHSAGNVTPVCYAQIVDGKYEMKPEERPATGRYRVLVMGIDESRIKKEPGVPWEMPELFPPYTTTIDVPQPNGTFDITIPDTKDRRTK